MKQAYLVTESKSDAEILKALLPKSIVRFSELVAKSGSYSALSSAATLLAVQHLPVALVINTNMLNELLVQEKVNALRELLRQSAAGVRYEIFPAVPEIETVFFQDRHFIESLADKTFTDMEWQFAKRSPKEALIYLLGNSLPLNKKILGKLDEATIRILQTHPLIIKLTDFLSSVVEPQKLAKAA
jgi:hypothetical protein